MTMLYLSGNLPKTLLGNFLRCKKDHVFSSHFYIYKNLNFYPVTNLSKCYQTHLSQLSKSVYPVRALQYSTLASEDGILSRMKKKTFGIFSNTTKVNIGACLVYEKCADNMSVNEFFEHFKLPDTFNSWFLMIQLHVWMVALVMISEANGRIFRNRLIEEMWRDVEERLSLLAVMKSSTKKRHLKALYEQFQAALISYDEGILDDDKALAASIWRTLYSFDNSIDPRLLESGVYYIRRQVSHLDTLNAEELITQGTISFLPLKDVLSDFYKQHY